MVAAGVDSLFALHKVTQGITDMKMSFYSMAPPCDRLTHKEIAEVHIIVGTQLLSVLFLSVSVQVTRLDWLSCVQIKQPD